MAGGEGSGLSALVAPDLSTKAGGTGLGGACPTVTCNVPGPVLGMHGVQDPASALGLDTMSVYFYSVPGKGDCALLLCL